MALESKVGHGFAGIICACVGIVVYLNTLDCGLCYDDQPGIINNGDLRSNVSWTNLLKNDFWGQGIHLNTSHKSYRPLCVATFRLNYLLHELHPMGYHLVNVLLHGIVCYLYVQLCAVVFSEVWPALIAGLLFAVHPIHTEAVASVVGRADTMAGLFYISSLLCYTRAAATNAGGTMSLGSMVKWLILSLFFCACGLLSKETGFTVLAACLVYDFFIVNEMDTKKIITLLKHHILTGNLKTSKIKLSTKRTLIRFAMVIVFGIVVGALRVNLNNGRPTFAIHDNPPLTFPSPWRQLQWLHLCFVNFWLMINPFSLSCDWRMGAVPAINSLTNPMNVATALTLLSICALGLYSISGGMKLKKHIVIALSLIIFPYIPASNLFFAVGFYVAERILYIPSMGVCILVSCGVWHLLQHTKSKPLRAGVWLAVGYLVLAYSTKTVQRNRDWHSNVRLFSSVLPIFPENALMMNNLGVEMNKHGNVMRAESLMRTAAALAPNTTLPHLALARMLREHKRFEEAEEKLSKAANLAPTDQPPDMIAKIYGELSALLIRNKTTEVKRLKKALRLLDAVMDMQADPPIELLHNRGYALLKLNRNAEAKEAFNAVLSLEDDHEGANYKMGEACLNLGELELAEYYFRKAVDLVINGSEMMTKFQLAALLIKNPQDRERMLEADELLDEIVSYEPDNENALFAYAVVKYGLDDLVTAEQLFLQVIAINSTHLSALYNLGFLYTRQENFSSAIRIFTVLLNHNPHHVTALAQLAGCYVRMGQLQKSIEIYESALVIDSRHVLALTNLGVVKRELGYLEESEQLLRRALELNLGDDNVKLQLKKTREALITRQQNSTIGSS